MSAPAEDERLALAAQGGDASAAEALLEKYKNMVRGIARRFFLAGGDAEDLVQEGMIGCTPPSPTSARARAAFPPSPASASSAAY